VRFKVFVETSVLVAASTFMVSKPFSFEIKDPFYDEAMRLVSLLRKHINKQIGITSSFVVDQTYRVLGYVIERMLGEKIEDKAKFYEILSITIDSCEDRLREVLSSLSQLPINPEETDKLYFLVTKMFAEKEKKAAFLPKPAIPMTKAAPRFLSKKELFNMYKNQDEILHFQLTNLLFNPVKDSDKKILARAAYFAKLYKETEGKNIRFFLASTDYHFVPYRREILVSRQVTDNIEEDFFGIICDRPHQIFLELENALK